MVDFNQVPSDSVPHPHEHSHEDYIEDETPILITRNEALFLDDSFTLMVEHEMEEHRIKAMRPVQMTAALAVPMELLEKIGKAVVYTTAPNNLNKDYEASFDMSELLMIREISSSYIKVGEETVGFNLKRKVCAVLYGEDLIQDERNKTTAHLLKDIDVDLTKPTIELQKTEQDIEQRSDNPKANPQ